MSKPRGLFIALCLCLTVAMPAQTRTNESEPGFTPQCIELPPGIEIVENGWCLTRVVDFTGGQAAHYNPIDGLLYVGRRVGNVQDGVYRIEADGSATKVADGDKLAAVVIDHEDGDIFFSEDYGGGIYRSAFGTPGRSTWVSGLHTGDDDPIGMAIAPDDYIGPVIAAGEAIVADRGAYGGLDEIWAFSPDTPETERVVHADDGTLVNAIDITVGLNEIYLVDTGDDTQGGNPGLIYRMDPGGSLTVIETASQIMEPVGIVTDPLTEDLLVLDAAGQSLRRVDPGTGFVSEVFTGISTPSTEWYQRWAGVDISPDGRQVFITDRGVDRIYALERVAPFARFRPRAIALQFVEPGSDGFSFLAEYDLNESSDGVFPDLEEVTVSFGTYTETIPAGSVVCIGFDCAYESTGPGITRSTMTPDSLFFQAKGIDLSGTANPVSLSIWIGNDGGSALERLEGALMLSSTTLGLCDPCADWKNHGEYVSCVAHAVEEMVTGGILTDGEASQYVSAAARSSIGKRRYLPAECQ